MRVPGYKYVKFFDWNSNISDATKAAFEVNINFSRYVGQIVLIRNYEIDYLNSSSFDFVIIGLESLSKIWDAANLPKKFNGNLGKAKQQIDFHLKQLSKLKAFI